MTMNKTYTEELVWTITEDRIRHEGVVIAPAGGDRHSFAVLWVHGLTGRFYESSAVGVGRGLATRGYTVVSGNNRGHDFGAVLNRGSQPPLLGGGAWELFDESPRDVLAWVNFVSNLGFAGVVLLGHSLGTLKVAYYQAQAQDPRVRGLIAASPPLRAGRRDAEHEVLAAKLVAEGRGMDLLPRNPDRPINFNQSAQALLNRARTSLDVYGWQNPDPAVARVRCPILAFLGTNEEWVGTASDLDVIRRNAKAAARVDTRMIEGADHVYTGQEDEVAALVAEWLQATM
jgi:pimeloyl-ACP methyl ester carboxylesterase